MQKRSLRRQVIRIAGIALLTIILSIVGVFTYVLSNQDKLVAKALQGVNESFQGEMIVEKTRISLFANFPYISIDLQNARYYDNKDRNTSPIYKINDLYVGFDIFYLLRGQFEVKKIRLKGGYIHLERDTAGVINLMASKNLLDDSADTSSGSWNLSLPSCRVENVFFVFKDNMTKREYDLNLEELYLKFRGDDHHVFIDLESDMIFDLLENGDTTFFHNKKLHLSWEMDYDIAAEKIFLFPSKLGIGDASFNVEGSIDLANEAYLDLTIKGDKPDFALFTAFAPPEVEEVLSVYQNAGRIYFEGRIQGRSANGRRPRVSVDFGCENVFFRNKEIDRKIDGLQFQGHFTNGEDRSLETSVLELRNFQAFPEEGEFRGSVFIKNFKDPYVKINLHADLDLEFIGQFFRIEGLKQIRGKVLLDMDLDELVDLNFGGENLAQLKQGVDSELRIKDLEFSIPDYPHRIKNVNAYANMQKGQFNLENLSFQLDNSNFKFSGSISDLPAIFHRFNLPVNVALQASFDKMDLARLLPNADSSTTEKIEQFALNISGRSNAKELFEFEYLPRGQYQIDHFYAQLNHFPHAFHDFSANIEIGDNEILINRFYGEIDQSDFQIKGKFNNFKKWFADNPQGDSELHFSLQSKKIRFNDLLTFKGENYLPEDYREEEIEKLNFQGHLDLHFDNGFQSADLFVDKFYGKMKIHPLKLEGFKGRIHFEDEHLTAENFGGKMGVSDFMISMNYFLGEDQSKQKIKNRLVINSKVLDLDALMNYQGPEAETNHEEAFNLFEVPFTNMDVEVNIGRMNYHKYWLEKFHTKLRIQENHFVHVDTLQLYLAGGNMRMKGYFNGSDPEKIYFFSTIHAKNLDIDKLMFKFDNFGQDMLINENIHGKITGTITSTFRMHPDLTPIIEESDAHMELIITDGSLVRFTPMLAMSDYFKDKNLNVIRFDTLQNVMDLKNGSLSFPNMTINSSLGFMQIAGTQNIDMSMEYFVRIPLKMVTQVGFSALFGGKKSSETDPTQLDEIAKMDPNRRTRFLNLRITGNPDEYNIGLGKQK
ncbi:MAG: membrane biogenesis protein [Flavobacteriales bacterium]|nr:MAG: membrane biogenesis protein [Flavobacteriales bacterium]